MSSPIYSTRFIGEPGVTALASFNVPAGYRAIVRDIDIFWVLGLSAADVNVTVNQAWTFAYFHWDPGADTTAVKSWRGRQVLNPGEDLVVLTDSAVDVTISGYLLSAP